MARQINIGAIQPKNRIGWHVCNVLKKSQFNVGGAVHTKFCNDWIDRKKTMTPHSDK